MERLRPFSSRCAEERSRLILEHLPQVRLIARRIYERLPGNISLDDLVSTGVLGLIAAVDNFDPAHSVKLKTYAEYKIKGAILDSLRELDWAPRRKRRMAKQIESAIAAAEQRLHRVPTEEEIAAQLQLSLEDYRRRLAGISAISRNGFESIPNEQQTRDGKRHVRCEDENLPSRLLERSELERLLTQAIDGIPRMERTVLSLYYHQELSLRQIAEMVNLHGSRISQLKSQGILRLRAYMEKRWPMPRGGRPRLTP